MNLNKEILDRETGVRVDPADAPLEIVRRRRAYAVSRVSRLSADIAPRIETCGDDFLPIACRCGLVGARQACRQWWLCANCRRNRSPALGARMTRGLRAALDREIVKWGCEGGRGTKPMIVLMTLTQKHSGDVGADQEALSVGWRKLYKRMNEDYGWFPYVGVWEATKGADGLGHVHLHVAVVWRYRDWWRINAQWRKACPTSSYITFVDKRRDGKPSTPVSVAKYIGKYLSKGADGQSFTPYLRAEVSAAFYNKHSVITSLGFWGPRIKPCCPKCHDRYRLVEIEAMPWMDRVQAGPISLYFHGLEPPSNVREPDS